MVSLYNINPESVYDGQQRSLDDFQFDLGPGSQLKNESRQR